MQRTKKEQKRLRTYLGRVIRDIERKLPKEHKTTMAPKLELAKRILTQQQRDHGKVYSMHAPEVESFAKGKAHKPYEFESKWESLAPAKRALWWE